MTENTTDWKKKRTAKSLIFILAEVFSCKFWEITKNIFFTEHLWATTSVHRFLTDGKEEKW